MHRAAHIGIFVLFSIALVLIGRAALLESSLQSPNSIAEAEPESTVEVYFAAVDRYLVSGNDRDLRRAVATEFTGWNSGSHTPGGYDAFVAQLDSARNLFPGLELQQSLLRVDGHVATVKLSASSTRNTSIAGVSITPSDLIGDTEILRFSDGLLVERWGFAPMSGRFTSYDATVGLAAESASLTRWTISDDDQRDRSIGSAALLLVVEAGSIRVRIEQEGNGQGQLWTPRGSGHAIEALTTLDLDPGAALYLPPRAIVRIWSPTGEPASVMAARLQTAFTQPPNAADLGDLPAGVSLGSSASFGFDGSAVRIELGAMHLGEGAEIRGVSAHGMTLVLVESGTVEAEAPDRSVTTLERGQIELTTPNVPELFRVASPTANLYLVTFTPL